MNTENDNVYWLIIAGIVLFVLGFSDYQMGGVDQVIETSEHDVGVLEFTYNEQVKAHNKINQEQLPKFNRSQMFQAEIVSFQKRSLSSLIALKNEGTHDFTVYHSGVANSNSVMGFAFFRLAAYNAYSREIALQQKAREIKAETPVVYGVILILIIINAIMERRRQ